MVIERVNIIIVAIVVVIAIIVVVVAILMKNKKRAFSKEYFAGKSKSKTDLDILYEMLKKEKIVSIYDIERAFKVDADVALGWAKILENADLAIIDYPRFGKPVLNIVDSTLKENEVGKKDIITENVVKKTVEAKEDSKAKKDIEKKKAKEEERMKKVARILERKKAEEEKRMKKKKIIEERKNKEAEQKKFKKEVLAKKLAEEKKMKEETLAKKLAEEKKIKEETLAKKLAEEKKIKEETLAQKSPGIFKRIKGFFSKKDGGSIESHVAVPLVNKKNFTKLPVVGESKKDAARIIQEELARLDHEEKVRSRK